jgi:F-type H+-transporting ATPase subunit b
MDALLATFGIEWKLLIAQAFNFSVVVWALWYFLYDPVTRMLDKRRLEIAKGIEDAKTAAHEKSEAQYERTKIRAQAQNEALELVGKAKKDAQDAGIVVREQTQEKVSLMLADAERTIASQKETMLHEASKDIARIAALTAEKVLSVR